VLGIHQFVHTASWRWWVGLNASTAYVASAFAIVEAIRGGCEAQTGSACAGKAGSQTARRWCRTEAIAGGPGTACKPRRSGAGAST